MFGAHYFFETFNQTSNATEGHAAYGELFPCKAGEVLETTFTQSFHPPGTAPEAEVAVAGEQTRVWELTMGVVGDLTRTSKLTVDKPYMGLVGGGGCDKYWLLAPCVYGSAICLYVFL